MQDPTSELKPEVSQIVADALQSAADGMVRWLDLPVNAETISSGSVERQVAEDSLAASQEALCYCVMPVALAVGVGGSADSAGSLPNSAGQLLMAWTADGAAKLIGLSLHCGGTPGDPAIWQSLDRSVIAETLNVVGCEFLNAVAVKVSDVSATEIALMPSPPVVSRQPAGSLIEVTCEEGQDEGVTAPQVCIAQSRLHVADDTIETRFVMVWTPAAWDRLHWLVENGGNTGGQP